MLNANGDKSYLAGLANGDLQFFALINSVVNFFFSFVTDFLAFDYFEIHSLAFSKTFMQILRQQTLFSE